MTNQVYQLRHNQLRYRIKAWWRMLWSGVSVPAIVNVSGITDTWEFLYHPVVFTRNISLGILRRVPKGKND